MQVIRVEIRKKMHTTDNFLGYLHTTDNLGSSSVHPVNFSVPVQYFPDLRKKLHILFRIVH